MEQLTIFSLLFIAGVLTHLIFFHHSGDIAMFLMRKFKFGWMKDKQFSNVKFSSPLGRMLWNMAGEGTTTDAKPVEFTPDQQKALDHIVQERLARDRQKFSDYDELKKFKTEYEQQQSQKAQEELIKQKKFEEAENTYKTKLNEYGQVLSKKDQEIQDLKIGHALTNEISKNNGYIEESIALLKGQTILDANGNVKVKGKDANGIDIEMPLMDGVKKFLEQRPHLVKANLKSGAGTGSGNATDLGSGSSGGGQTGDLNSLNAELMQASRGNDLKKVSEIKQKIRNVMNIKGVH